MNNKKLFFSVVSALIVMCAILSGCTEKNEHELEQKAIETEQWDIGKNVDEGLPQDRLNEKIKLTVGGIGLNESSIMGSINEFNATNEKYQIVTEDYADAAASLDQARTVMQTKAMAGDGPDIISFEGISPLKWIGAGMLYNMDGLVAEDPDINENDILIWNALHEYNGLYLMSPTFWTETLACSSETMQKYEGWTINDYLEIEKSLDSNQSMIYYMNPENFLVSIGGRYLQKALDLVDASCDFDNEEFISILESAVQAGCYEATYDPNETGQQKVIRGKLICFFSGLMTGQDVAFDREECGQTLSYIGWPTVDGSNGTDIRLTQAVGINKATKNIEGCWEFVKYLLKNPILIDNASGMPTYAPLVNEDLKMLNSGEPKFKTTEEDMEIVINLAKESEQLTYYDEEVMNIILNESSAFIQGNTSASETAKRIQSRVSLYMKEQYE